MFGLVAVLVIDTFPLALLADVGLKSTVKVMLWPAAKVTGSVTPVSVKPAPEAVSWEICTVPLCAPVLVSAIDIDFAFPTGTVPKFRAELLEDKFPVGGEMAGEVLPIFVPAHPALNNVVKTRMEIKQ